MFVQAEGLQGNDKVTHPFARVMMGEQSQLTSVQWQTLSPEWDEALSFRYGDSATAHLCGCVVVARHPPAERGVCV